MRQLHYRVDGRVARNLSPTCMPFTRRRREDVHFPGNTLITGNAIRHTQGAPRVVHRFKFEPRARQFLSRYMLNHR